MPTDILQATMASVLESLPGRKQAAISCATSRYLSSKNSTSRYVIKHLHVTAPPPNLINYNLLLNLQSAGKLCQRWNLHHWNSKLAVWGGRQGTRGEGGVQQICSRSGPGRVEDEEEKWNSEGSLHCHLPLKDSCRHCSLNVFVFCNVVILPDSFYPLYTEYQIICLNSKKGWPIVDFPIHTALEMYVLWKNLALEIYSVYSQIQSLSCHLLQKQGGIYQVKINNHKQIYQSLKTYFVYTFFYSTIIDMCNLLKDHHSQGSSTANFEAFDLFMMMMLVEYDHTYENYHWKLCLLMDICSFATIVIEFWKCLCNLWKEGEQDFSHRSPPSRFSWWPWMLILTMLVLMEY